MAALYMAIYFDRLADLRPVVDGSRDTRTMRHSDSPPHWLFSYGTLRQPDVQRATFDRELQSEPDILCGYSLSMLDIIDPAVIATSGSDTHPIVRWTGDESDEVEGVALGVTADELAAADGYEVSDYRRVAVMLKSGRHAFVYVSAQP